VKVCKVETCERRHHARGYCHVHYARMDRFGTTEPIRSLPEPPPVPCKVPGCPRTLRAHGFCNTHYEQVRRTGRLLAPKRPRRVTRAQKEAQRAEGEAKRRADPANAGLFRSLDAWRDARRVGDELTVIVARAERGLGLVALQALDAGVSPTDFRDLFRDEKRRPFTSREIEDCLTLAALTDVEFERLIARMTSPHRTRSAARFPLHRFARQMVESRDEGPHG
jgi:hypothetical protein